MPEHDALARPRLRVLLVLSKGRAPLSRHEYLAVVVFGARDDRGLTAPDGVNDAARGVGQMTQISQLTPEAL